MDLSSRRGCSSAGAHDLGSEGLERVPVVGAFAECDAEPGAAQRAELVHHRARVLDGAAQVAGAIRPVAAAAPVALEHLLAPGRAPRVGAQVEAQVDGAHDGLRIASLGLAPAVQHLALVGPVLGADVGPVPPVGVLGGGAERALLATSPDPDRDAW